MGIFTGLGQHFTVNCKPLCIYSAFIHLVSNTFLTMLAIEFMVVRFNMILLCTDLSQAFRETCLKHQSQYFYICRFSYSATSNLYTKQITTLNSLLCQKGQFTPLIVLKRCLRRWFDRKSYITQKIYDQKFFLAYN